MKLATRIQMMISSWMSIVIFFGRYEYGSVLHSREPYGLIKKILKYKNEKDLFPNLVALLDNRAETSDFLRIRRFGSNESQIVFRLILTWTRNVRSHIQHIVLGIGV